MGKHELQSRDKWQDKSGENAKTIELDFYEVFNNEFNNSKFEIVRHPNDFSNIYNSVQLQPNVQKSIYQPNEDWRHGFIPDFAIRNKSNSKTLYVEVKRQDGWVENKPRSAGRGNAHERSCKFFTPGLLKILREKGNIQESLPFWVVFQGDITRDPKRVREITFWYDDFESHFFFWYDLNDKQVITTHFYKKLSYLLE